MPAWTRLAVERCAVVVIDVQNDFCHPEGVLAQQGADVSRMDAMVDKLAPFLATARSYEVPVIFVTTTHDPSTDSPGWLARHLRPRDVEACKPGSWGAEHYRITPEPGDYVIEKHRYSAFTATSLEFKLQELDRSSLILCGVSTNVCVESTLRDAVDLDLLATLAHDCCAAFAEGATEHTIATVESAFGLVADSKTITDYWSSPAG